MSNIPLSALTTPSSRVQDTSSNRGPLKRSSRHDIDPKGYEYEISEDEIFEATNQHEKFEQGTYTFHDLPKFDDPARYGLLDDAERKSILKDEIHRLRNAAVSDEALLFNSDGVFGVVNSSTLRNLSHVADQILCNCALITLDNQVMVIEQCRTLTTLQEAINDYRHALDHLKTRYSHNEKFRPLPPTIIKPPPENDKVYFALVDFMSSTVARLLVRSAVNKYWTSHLLAILAQWSLKLKVLASNQASHAEQALANAEDAVPQLISEAQDDPGRIGRFSMKYTDALHLDVHEELDPNLLYYEPNQNLRRNLMSVLRSAVSSTFASTFYGRPVDDFECCTMMYETGLERSLAVLCQERDGDVASTSSPMHTRICYRALSLAFKNLEAVKTSTPPQPRPMTPRADISSGKHEEPSWIAIDWERATGVKDSTHITDKFQTSSTDSLISAIVPISLCSPWVAAATEGLIQYVASIAENDDPIRFFKRQHLQAKCTLRSATFIAKLPVRELGQRSHTDTVPISEGPLIKRKRGDALNDEQWRRLIHHQTKQKPLTAKQFQRGIDEMDSWVFSEVSVTVRCWKYVIGVLTLSTLLILAALAIPFSVRSKIQGVDPFQMTLFIWLVVGVILLAAKSRYVSVWPWHDFVHGRVVCSSVTDLNDVTGIDSQLILTKLLNNERKTTLKTRGPYNGMFSRKGSEGFSIDVPIALRTMLDSGYVTLQVLSEKGEHVVVLDARKEAGLDYASTSTSTSTYLSCLDPPKLDDESDEVEAKGGFKDGKGKDRVVILGKNDTRWQKLLGLYISDSVFG